jgi:hypothetical protein
MGESCEELLRRAKANPAGLRFVEICRLAECFGFVFARQRGSHVLHTRFGRLRPLNFQADNGMAKAYQVRQLLMAISDLDVRGGV